MFWFQLEWHVAIGGEEHGGDEVRNNRTYQVRQVVVNFYVSKLETEKACSFLFIQCQFPVNELDSVLVNL